MNANTCYQTPAQREWLEVKQYNIFLFILSMNLFLSTITLPFSITSNSETKIGENSTAVKNFQEISELIVDHGIKIYK